jgi:hypothetical protein
MVFPKFGVFVQNGAVACHPHYRFLFLAYELAAGVSTQY